MAVSARPAKSSLAAANPDLGFVDMRAGTPVRAGTYLYDGADLITGWHHHDLHQIEYALEGLAHVETTDARYLVPPEQAVWVPAGLTHCTTLHGRSVAVFFEPTMLSSTDDRAHVLPATPVLREMMSYATRWPIERTLSDETADSFFEALILLARDWIDHEAPLCLPTSTDPIIQAAMNYTQAHLADISGRAVASSVGVSERTLRRRFLEATGSTWQQYLHRSRLMRATALLAQSRRTVLEVAIEVGYDSASAFGRAFYAFTGEHPSSYSKRARARSSTGRRT
jgi:AraC-like DNA-binding protein/mannose-6-phosphate isomerase-like protein (cupin superfamily)